MYSVAAGPLLLLSPLFLLLKPFSALSFQLKLLQSALYLSFFSILSVARLSAVAWRLLVVVLHPLVVVWPSLVVVEPLYVELALVERFRLTALLPSVCTVSPRSIPVVSELLLAAQRSNCYLPPVEIPLAVIC